ncbi:MAG: zinc-dependent metalloprotease [Candidatus Marinimicrobia bacterium]|nr:zinc-dependent metalloprotease [Candidatus Neomarinimicrobiota bacterium]MCF7829800.1 zinc-dependent metalloprotease [Candidatus Neomarinimicrobiota bacterium]MCF7881767.1 zinc-dependent metalloprotease [Candidatus Neomarinimicrobiota bacterium]
MLKKFSYNMIGLVLFLFGGIILAFCVFSNSDKEYRIYLTEDLPFIYHINQNTKDDYYIHIQQGANTWNDIPGSFFEFDYGGETGVFEVARDDTNLVYFDAGEGGNFETGTNTIAFSLTFTSESDTFRSLESDLIWNAREFPPAYNGESDFIDLQSTITHELGHHMGMGHFTEFGSPPGCGDEYPDATMAGGVAPGDINGRTLHAQDIAAAIELYPEWELWVAVNDTSGAEIPYAEIELVGATGIFTIEPESIPGPYDIMQCPGYLVGDSVLTDAMGERFLTVDDPSFQLIVNAFGYTGDTITVDFQPANDIVGPEIIQTDVVLEPKPWQRIQVSMQDSSSGSRLHGTAEFYGIGDPSPAPTSVLSLEQEKSGSVNLPPGQYDVHLVPEYPWASTWYDSVTIVPDSSYDLPVTPAQVLVISGAKSSTSDIEYTTILDTSGYRYHYWDVSVMEDSLPPSNQFWRFKRPMKLFLISETENGTYLNNEWKSYLQNNAEKIGNILLAGNDIASRLFWNTNFLDLGIQIDGSSYTNKRNMKTPVDNALTRKWGKFEYEQVSLSENASNQAVLDTLAGYPNTVALEYENDGGPGLVYHEGDSLKVVVAPFSIYEMIQFDPKWQLNSADLLQRIDQWFDISIPTAIEDDPAAEIPDGFTMMPNYPNPFNPSTTITWNLPAPSDVMIRVYNIRGQIVLQKQLGTMEPGQHKWTWDISSNQNQNLSSGIYWLELTAAKKRRIQKLMLLK